MIGQILGGVLAGGRDVEMWKDVSTTESQKKAIAGNLQNLPEAQKLAGQTNTFNQAELERMLAASIPGYKNMMAQGSEIVQSQLGGELSESELRAMRRNEAAYGASSGTGGSDFLAKKTLRDLGLGTLERQQQGLTNAQSWIRNAAALTVPQMFNISSMFLSPMEVWKADFENQRMALGQKEIQNQIDWASNWKTLTGKAIADFDKQVMDTGFGIAGMFTGNMLGGGGGGGGSSLPIFSMAQQAPPTGSYSYGPN